MPILKHGDLKSLIIDQFLYNANYLNYLKRLFLIILDLLLIEFRLMGNIVSDTNIKLQLVNCIFNNRVFDAF